MGLFLECLPVVRDLFIHDVHMRVLVHHALRFPFLLSFITFREQGCDSGDDHMRVHAKVWSIECDHSDDTFRSPPRISVRVVGGVCRCICGEETSH